MKSRYLHRALRFWGAWIVASFALAGAMLVTGLGLEVAVDLGFPHDPDLAQRLYAHPLAVSVFWAAGGMAVTVILGAPFVAWRRHIVQPTAPFLRPGYLVVAATPLLLCMLSWQLWGRLGPALAFAAALEVPTLIAALIYVWLARAFDLFDPDEWPPGHAAQAQGVGRDA